MSNEQQHDPTVTLRLELGRITDQRDAFKAALHKDVLAVVREAIAESSRLKAEVSNLKDRINFLEVQIDDVISKQP